MWDQIRELHAWQANVPVEICVLKLGLRRSAVAMSGVTRETSFEARSQLEQRLAVVTESPG